MGGGGAGPSRWYGTGGREGIGGALPLPIRLEVSSLEVACELRCVSGVLFLRLVEFPSAKSVRNHQGNVSRLHSLSTFPAPLESVLGEIGPVRAINWLIS
jgi:hypothetical protein